MRLDQSKIEHTCPVVSVIPRYRYAVVEETKAGKGQAAVAGSLVNVVTNATAAEGTSDSNFLAF